jgi:hypothetical protein
MKNPKCRLTGTDGNVFAIIGAVCKALRRVDLKRADEFRKRALASTSYDAVLQLAMDYVDVS